MKFIELTFIIVCCLQAAAWLLWTRWHKEQHRKDRLYLGEALKAKANCRKPRKKSSPSNASGEGDGASK